MAHWNLITANALASKAKTNTRAAINSYSNYECLAIIILSSCNMIVEPRDAEVN